MWTTARCIDGDTGEGISKDGQAKLFEVFSQVDDSTTRYYEVQALGLRSPATWPRPWMAAWGWRAKGLGSTFYLVLTRPEELSPSTWWWSKTTPTSAPCWS